MRTLRHTLCILGVKRCAPATFVVATLAALCSAQTVSLSSTSVTFGNIAVGSTSAGSIVTLTNTGTVALSISSIMTAGNFAQTNNCGNSVKAAAHCTMTIKFSPTVAGASSGSVAVSDNAAGTPQTIALVGTGVVPVKLSPVTLSFGNTPMGTTSAPIVVTLSNNLTTSLAIPSITATGDFAQTNTCGFAVAGNKTCTITVTFTPTVGGPRSGTLTVTDSAANSPQIASLAGSGAATGALAIAVSPPNASAQAGATQQFAAIGTFPGGVYDVTQAVTWSSSKTGIATISNTSGAKGLAAVLTGGTTTIKATQGSVSGSTLFTGISLLSIAVSPPHASVGLGGGQQFTATGTFSDTSQKNLTSSVGWSSSAPTTATVNNAGLASSVGVGSATIVATLGSVSGSASLTINPATLVTIAVTPANSSVPLGIQQQCKAVGTYSDGSTQDLTASVAWSSSGNIASFSAQPGSQGLASSLTTGSTTITASLGSISGSTGLTVSPATLDSIVVTPAVPSIPSGVSQQFIATGTFTDRSTQSLTTSVTWSSSAGIVATIGNTTGSQGLAMGVSAGATTITATSGSISGGTTLTVVPAALLSIAVNPVNPSIPQGTTQPFTATGTFTDNSTQDLTASVTWASSGVGFATISAAGVATGVGSGTTSISATLGSVNGATTLSVTTTSLVSITVNPTSASIPLGTTQAFTATGTFSDGSSQDVTGTAYWTSSNGTIATVSDAAGTQGLANSLGAGVTTITATSGAVSGSANLSVIAAALQSMAIAPQNPSVALGTSQPFTATGTYTDGSTQDLTTTVIWGSAQSSVAVISNAAGTQGLSTTAGAGSTLITATFGTQSAQTTLTVATPTLLSIAINPSTSTVAVGGTQSFTATGTFSDGGQRDITSQAQWTSTNSAVATVAGGLAMALGSGSTTIQATLTVTGSATLAVLPSTPLPPTGVSTSAGNAQVGLSWSPSPGATGYMVARSTTSGGPYTVIASVTTNSFTNIGLTNNKIYYYVIVAVGLTGNSGYSAEVNATPQVLPGSGKAYIYYTTWNGIPREYVVYVPAALQANPAMVLVLHGTAIVAQNQPPLTVYHNMGWDTLADAYGFLLVQPIATYKPSIGSFFWESFGTETYFPVAPDDTGFLRSLIFEMQQAAGAGGFSVDPNRVFVMGFSSGGMMTHTLAITSSDLIAAAAPFSGTIYVATPPNPFAQPTQPVSIIEFGADADTTIYYCGGRFYGWGEGLIPTPSIDVDVNYWLAADGLRPNTTPLCTNGQPSPNVFQIDSGPGKIEVQVVRELGYDHNYKQSGVAMAWEFFSTHGR